MICAAFGAPVATPNNERNAVFCALEMMQKLKLLSEKYEARIQHPIEMGIGINSGEVVAGNLGSEDKLSYSLTGDTVNTGKRIESLTKDHPNSVLISQAVFERVQDIVTTKAWSPIEVKGKKDPIQVYEVLDRVGIEAGG